MPQVHFNIGGIYIQSLQIGKAVVEFKRCAELNLQVADYHHSLCLVAMQRVKANPLLRIEERQGEARREEPRAPN